MGVQVPRLPSPVPLSVPLSVHVTHARRPLPSHPSPARSSYAKPSLPQRPSVAVPLTRPLRDSARRSCRTVDLMLHMTASDAAAIST